MDGKVLFGNLLKAHPESKLKMWISLSEQIDHPGEPNALRKVLVFHW